jgi:hypothetical protein
MRAAAAARGALTVLELEEFATRDFAIGRTCVDPVPGQVQGITASGELLVHTATGVRSFRDGSLTLAETTA